MKSQTVSLVIAVLLAAPSLCYTQSREDALKPHLNRIWERWADLPSQYQKQHRPTLQRYLDLFTTSNGFTWNREWTGFAQSMGSDFMPFYANVIEAMKIAEAYEAGFPNPEDKLPKIAEAIFGSTPTNALLFVHNDFFETVLLLQQQNGIRGDVILINSSRLMDQSYMQIALDRYPKTLTFVPTEISKTVFNAALRRKDEGDSQFTDLRVVNGKAHAEGIQLINSLTLLMMKEIARSLSERPVLFLPSLHKPASVHAWRDLQNAGIFFTWQKAPATTSVANPIAEWQDLIDAAAPAGAPVHGEMANAIGQSVHAAVGIFDSKGMRKESNSLLDILDQRVKSVTMVSGRDVEINKDGKMIQRAESTVPSKAAPSASSDVR